LLEVDPASSEAFDAAVWILLNTADGSEVEKAAEVIQRFHVDRSDAGTLAQELERVRHRSAKTILQSILERNPFREHALPQPCHWPRFARTKPGMV
jgi:hypothetical protein